MAHLSRRSASLCVALALMTGCARAPEVPQPAPASNGEVDSLAGAADRVVARIGDRAITAGESDASILLALHDLDMQKHRLRRQAVEAVVLHDLEKAPGPKRVAETSLVPPVP